MKLLSEVASSQVDKRCWDDSRKPHVDKSLITPGENGSARSILTEDSGAPELTSPQTGYTLAAGYGRFSDRRDRSRELPGLDSTNTDRHFL